MAVYDSELYLREAIDSILGQTLTDFQFLIINDGSTDSSRDIVLSYDDPRIRLVDNPENIGLTKSLNRGLSLVRSEYVARQDADDRSHCTRLQKQVAFLDNYPEVAVVGTGLRCIDAQGRELRVPREKRAVDPLFFRWSWIFDNPLAHSTTMFRQKVVWNLLGGYDDEYRTSQDFELWSRVGRSYDLCNLPDVLVDFRIHKDSVSKHYQPEDILKLEKIYQNNINRLLQSEKFPKKFPMSWLHITMPTLVQIYDCKEVLQMIIEIRERFVSLYPRAANHPDIRNHWALVLARCARYFAPVSRLGSWPFIMEGLRTAKLPLRELAAYAVLFLFGDRAVKRRNS